MKRKGILVTVLCACAMLLALIPFGGCADSANAVFEIIEGTQTARLVSLTGSVKNYTVPELYQNCPVVEIDEMAFTQCYQLETLTVPACVENFPTHNLSWNFRLKEINYEGTEHYKSEDGVMYSADGKKLLCYPTAKSGEIFVIPDTVETIANSAIQSPTHLKEIIIPESVRFVEQYGFVCTKNNNSSDLKKVTVKAETIATIMSSFTEFNDCFLLEADELVVTGGKTFPDEGLTCFPTVTKIRLPEGLKKIGDGFTAFYSNYPIAEVNIPSTVEEIGREFCMNAEIESVTLPQGLKQLGADSFFNCKNLQTLVIPDGVEIPPTQYGAGMICGGEESGLKSVTASLKVASAVSCNDFDLEEIVITGVEVDEQGYGYEVNALKIVFESIVTAIPDDSLVLGPKVKEIEFKGNISEIAGMFIYGSEEGTSIVIPESVTYINATNFETPSNTYVTLLFKGSESSVTIEGSFVENISVVWDYVEEPENEENEEIEE